MKLEDDRSYYSRRALQERYLARSAADTSSAKAHQRLAAEYERRLNQSASVLHLVTE